MRRFGFIVLCLITLYAHTVLADNRVAMQGSDNETIADLSIKWWRWVTNAPDERDPLADEDGGDCNFNQNGNIFFLVGSYTADKVSRKCSITADTYLFFPVINMMRWDNAQGMTCDALKADVKIAIDTAKTMSVELDGQPINITPAYRAAPESCFAIPGDEDHYASDGYWLLLKPLSKGTHTIHFKGRLGDDGKTVEDLIQDIEYILEVK